MGKNGTEKEDNPIERCIFKVTAVGKGVECHHDLLRSM